jgi:putative flavoprotein involved in K+ transport
VLVVGGGNTGYQIAEELSATHEVHLSIGSRQLPFPQRLFGRDLFRFLDAIGAMNKTVDSRIGSRLKDRDTLIGSSPRAARKLRIRLHARTTTAAGSSVSFADGTSVDVRTVIWATGFGVDHTWIDAPIFDDHGRLIQQRGVTPSAGLYFLGLPWQHTRGSALLGSVKRDAAHIAHALATHKTSTDSSTVPRAAPRLAAAA